MARGVEKRVYGLLILNGFLASRNMGQETDETDDSAVIIPSSETCRSPDPASNSGKREKSEDVRKRQEDLVRQSPAHRLE